MLMTTAKLQWISAVMTCLSGRIKTWPLMLVLVGVNTSYASEAVLMEFSSAHCPPCQAMKGVVSELISQGVPVRQIDVGREPHQARRYGIRSTPTYLILREGREMTRLQGVQSISALRNALQQDDRGPHIPTRSRTNSFDQPHTRLAPLPGFQDRAFDDSASHAIRQPTRSVSRSIERSSESMPNMTLADAVERAQAATVRLRVFDGRGYGAGTGTIIDAQGEEALVLTCGHLFRDTHSDPESANSPDHRIEVDLFIGGEPKTVTGQLIDFDADNRDIGLVAIRPGFPVQPVTVLGDQNAVRVGQSAFSFGCDRGDPPTRRDTRITGVDKYNQNVNASNLEIDGAPIDGRSGGGLFDNQGRLIGVCNAADYKSDIGIYTGPRSVYWQLDRVRLSKLYQQSAPASSVASNPSPLPSDSFQSADLGVGNPEPKPTEMIVILRQGDGSLEQQVLTLDRPDARLVEQIRRAAQRR